MSVETQTQPTAPERPNPTNHRAQRVRAIGASALAAATTWAVVDIGLGLDLAVPSFDSDLGVELGVGPVIATTLATTLLGWALLALLERTTARPKTPWTAVAVGVTLISLAGPLSGAGVTFTQRLALVVLHLVVAAAYIPLMRRTFT